MSHIDLIELWIAGGLIVVLFLLHLWRNFLLHELWQGILTEDLFVAFVRWRRNFQRPLPNSSPIVHGIDTRPIANRVLEVRHAQVPGRSSPLHGAVHRRDLVSTARLRVGRLSFFSRQTESQEALTDDEPRHSAV